MRFRFFKQEEEKENMFIKLRVIKKYGRTAFLKEMLFNKNDIKLIEGFTPELIPEGLDKNHEYCRIYLNDGTSYEVIGSLGELEKKINNKNLLLRG